MPSKLAALNRIKAIAFDADDTLWHNESRFQEVQACLSKILDHYAPHDRVKSCLHDTEVRNIRLFGYGVKGFTLSMIETAIEISERTIAASDIHEIVMLGKKLLDAPMEILDHVDETLRLLGQHYPLYLITKGDVMDQRNKIGKSGLESYFERTDVVQEKDPQTYAALFSEFEVSAMDIVMVGNSIKSDILPILALGATAIHIPYHVTASFEIHNEEIEDANFYEVSRISDLPEFFGL